MSSLIGYSPNRATLDNGHVHRTSSLLRMLQQDVPVKPTRRSMQA